jgi:outer membrane lipoprotein SlyB
MTDRQSATADIREAVGAFVDADKIHEAIDELVASGFRYEELGLLAGEFTVRQSLGDFYTQTNQFSDSPDAPNTAFVAKESVGDTVHAFIGTLFFAGSTVGAGAAVASAGILGGGLLAAVTGVAAIGAVGAVLGLIIRESDAEKLEQQVDEGHLLLFVRTRDEEHEKQAVEILERHTPIEVRVVTAPASA